MWFSRRQQKEPWQERSVLPERSPFFHQRFVQPSLVWGSLAAFVVGNMQQEFYQVISWQLVVASFFFIFFISVVVYHERD